MKLAPTSKDLASRPPPGAPFDIEQHLIDVAASALNIAWQLLVSRFGNRVLDDETTTTRELHNLLGHVRASDRGCRLFNELFEVPVLESQQKAFREDKEYRQFDLILRPKKAPPGINAIYFGLFIECKLLVRGNKEFLQYTKNGIHRFVVDSDYAHWMKQAMMLAYSDSTFSHDELLCYLATSRAKQVDVCVPISHHVEVCVSSCGEILVTDHERQFRYPNGDNPGNIQLYHLWLNAI